MLSKEQRDYFKHYRRRYRVKNPDYYIMEKRKQNQRHRDLKTRVFEHYCNGEICCQRCGIEDTRCMQLHHKNNSGKVHRELLKSSGSIEFYRRIEKEGLPEGLEVLCANCHQIEHSL